MSDEHQSFIKNPRQLIVVVLLAFVVPIAVISLFSVLVSTTIRSGTGSDAMTPEAIAERLRPVGRLEVGDAGAATQAAPDGAQESAATTAPEASAESATPAAPAAAASATPATAAPADSDDAPAPAGDTAGAAATQASAGDPAAGAAVYKATCAACHNTGVAGAPKHGDAAAWKPRLAQGFDVLVKHSIGGLGAMPPRGGNMKLTDEQLRDSVAYMVDAVQ